MEQEEDAHVQPTDRKAPNPNAQHAVVTLPKRGREMQVTFTPMAKDSGEISVTLLQAEGDANDLYSMAKDSRELSMT